MVRATIIELNLVELYHFPCIISLDRCDGNGNTVKDLFGGICVSNKIEDVNLKECSMIKGINRSKTVVEHISCECSCEFDGTKCNSNKNGTLISANVNVKS